MEWMPALELFVKILSGLVLPAMFFMWKGLTARIDKIEKAAKERSDEIKAEIEKDIDKLEKNHASALGQFYASRETELRAFYEKREADAEKREAATVKLYKEFVQKDQFNSSIAKNEQALNSVFDQLRDLNAAVNRLAGNGGRHE